MGKWNSVWGSGWYPREILQSNAPAEQVCKKTHVAWKPPVGAACPPHHPFPTALRKSKGPQILRRWGHLEHTRRNWGDEAEMMRRLKMLPSINKCNTLQSLKEWALCWQHRVSGAWPGGYTQCPQDEHTRGSGAKGLSQGPEGCWRRRSWQKWEHAMNQQEQWIVTQWKVRESTLVLRQGVLARQAVLERETKVRPRPYRSKCVDGTRK